MDYHDQKQIFKGMHHVYQDNDSAKQMPSWVTGHSYIIDWFLWFMASRGYTLQKTRKKGVEFLDFPDMRGMESEILKSFLSKKKEQRPVELHNKHTHHTITLVEGDEVSINMYLSDGYDIVNESETT